MEISRREHARPGKKLRTRPSALRLLVRTLLALWWTFVVVAALSGVQALGNNSGQAILTLAPQFLAFVRRQPWQMQLLADVGAAYVIALMAGLTVLAYRAKRAPVQARVAKAATQGTVEVEIEARRAPDTEVVPQLDMTE